MGRAPCCSKGNVKRGAWTPEEDEILCKYIQAHGEGNWRKLPNNAGLERCGKSCRLRWMNYLRPNIKRGNFSEEEEDLIIRLHNLLGNRWSLIARRIPGRTDNEIKNYWNTHLSKKLLHLQRKDEPPIRICRPRRPPPFRKQVAETAPPSSPRLEEDENKRNASAEEMGTSSFSWEELLNLESLSNDEDTVNAGSVLEFQGWQGLPCTSEGPEAFPERWVGREWEDFWGTKPIMAATFP